MPQHSLKARWLVYLTFCPMALGLNLFHLAPVPVLILNANIIPSSVKPPVADGASGKFSHISGESIFGGSATVEL